MKAYAQGWYDIKQSRQGLLPGGVITLPAL